MSLWRFSQDPTKPERGGPRSSGSSATLHNKYYGRFKQANSGRQISLPIHRPADRPFRSDAYPLTGARIFVGTLLTAGIALRGVAASLGVSMLTVYAEYQRPHSRQKLIGC